VSRFEIHGDHGVFAGKFLSAARVVANVSGCIQVRRRVVLNSSSSSSIQVVQYLLKIEVLVRTSATLSRGCSPPPTAGSSFREKPRAKPCPGERSDGAR
jgi:hypothetical protein